MGNEFVKANNGRRMNERRIYYDGKNHHLNPPEIPVQKVDQGQVHKVQGQHRKISRERREMSSFSLFRRLERIREEIDREFYVLDNDSILMMNDLKYWTAILDSCCEDYKLFVHHEQSSIESAMYGRHRAEYNIPYNIYRDMTLCDSNQPGQVLVDSMLMEREEIEKVESGLVEVERVLEGLQSIKNYNRFIASKYEQIDEIIGTYLKATGSNRAQLRGPFKLNDVEKKFLDDFKISLDSNGIVATFRATRDSIKTSKQLIMQADTRQMFYDTARELETMFTGDMEKLKSSLAEATERLENSCHDLTQLSLVTGVTHLIDYKPKHASDSECSVIECRCNDGVEFPELWVYDIQCLGKLVSHAEQVESLNANISEAEMDSMKYLERVAQTKHGYTSTIDRLYTEYVAMNNRPDGWYDVYRDYFRKHIACRELRYDSHFVGSVRYMIRRFSTSKTNFLENFSVDEYVSNFLTKFCLCQLRFIQTKLPILRIESQAVIIRAIDKRVNFCEHILVARQDAIFNRDLFNCSICLDDVQPGDGLVLSECLHTFCKGCLDQHVRASASETASVTCPFVYSDLSRCSGFINHREMKSFLTRDAYEWCLGQSLQIAEGGFKNAVHCGFPDCDYWAVVGEDEPRPDCFMDCPKCGRSTCMKCDEIHGRELDCERLRLEINNKNSKLNEITVQKQISDGLARKCPNCGVVIVKNGGCNHMKCTKCKHDFTWTGIG